MAKKIKKWEKREIEKFGNLKLQKNLFWSTKKRFL